MRVTLDRFVLCEGDGNEETEDLRVTSREALQEDEAIDAASAPLAPRGNTRTVVSFTVTREHADERACEAFILTHHKAIPKNPARVVLHSTGAGSSEHVLTDGQIEASEGRQIGKASIFSYTIKGGAI